MTSSFVPMTNPDPCGAARSAKSTITCELPTGHLNDTSVSAHSVHRGRDRAGRWYEWPEAE